MRQSGSPRNLETVGRLNYRIQRAIVFLSGRRNEAFSVGWRYFTQSGKRAHPCLTKVACSELVGA
jgi:hypothetical protein